MNEYSFIVEFDEMSENQINKLWEYLSERNIKFHVLKDEDLKNENQQKEFIEYLENERNYIKAHYSQINGNYMRFQPVIETLEKVLEKYKEIIGGDNK